MPTVERQVPADTDDASGKTDGTWFSNSFDYIYIVPNSVDFRIYNWFRFTNITIPPGATIITAYLLVRARSTQATSHTLEVRGILEPDTATFLSNPIARAVTIAATQGDPGSWAEGSWYKLPAQDSDLVDEVQEIVNQATWASGNAMGFRCENTVADANVRRASTREHDTTYAAKLYIEWSVGVPRPAAMAVNTSLIF